MRAFILALLMISLMSSCASKKSKVLKHPTSKTSHKGGTGRPSKGSTSMAGLDYIDKYKYVAMREMNQYGIPASIKLAQALLESGNGNSYLAREANNHFGIKCGGVWRGKSIARQDDSPNDCFRVYDNAEDSFRDHSQFLLRKRYEKLFALDKSDYKGWAKGLKEAGYATNPRYPELLIDLIERYDLHKYDTKESYVEREIREVRVEELIEKKVVQEPAVNAEQIKSPIAMIIHEVKPSQTLYSISKQYNVEVEQIKLLNNLASDNLSIGQLLVISK